MFYLYFEKSNIFYLMKTEIIKNDFQIEKFIVHGIYMKKNHGFLKMIQRIYHKFPITKMKILNLILKYQISLTINRKFIINIKVLILLFLNGIRI